MQADSQAGVERHLRAILSADAVGYSRRMAENDAATVAAIRSRRQTFSGYVREHHGRIVGTAGDNVLAEFTSSIDAVACAVAVQTELAETEAGVPEGERLRFRIGIHLGSILVEEGEIFGDGINVAARLEGLALPGGICASAVVIDEVRGKVAGSFEDLGEQSLKNIPVPVRAFRIRLPHGQDDTPPAGATIPGFSGRPVLAVLPFEDRGTDASLSYLADGIAEDLIARFSAFRLFPVISSSSTASYKGRRADIRQVSRELGARYLVAGSIQGSGAAGLVAGGATSAQRIRVAVELVDGSTGLQIHRERYDRELGDVFELQDGIVLAILSSIEPAIGRAEQLRIRQKPAPHLDSWECFQKGAHLLFGLRAKGELDEAMRLLRRSRELDPSFSTAAALETVCHAAMLTYHWSDDPARTVADARAAAEMALSLSDDDPWAYAAMGYATSYGGDTAAAVAAFERAIDLNPSLTMAYQGLAVALTTESPDEAIRVMEKAIRLSPRDQQMHFFLHQLAVANLVAGRLEAAVEREKESLRLRGDQPHGYRVLAAALGHLGRSAEALEALATMRRISPSFSLDTFRQTNTAALAELCIAGWRRAGWNG
ncbi:MAG TPA: adenylate/guanylate cyclase domain-containing protein [Candidatus Limnocylindrales bacterium]|nr:adenylate/guanylate cyclase domain-containing protein [Candidatus Limnocylindrales bacterium]